MIQDRQESSVPDQSPQQTSSPSANRLTLRRRLQLAYPLTTRLVALTYALYAILAFAVYFFSKRSGADISLCTFKKLTGHPCATCGGTRAAVRLAHLDLLGAIEYNPFATALLIGFAAWFVITFLRAGRPLITWTSRRRAIAFALVVAALALNWVYVWHAEPRLTARDQAAHAAQQPAQPAPFSIPR